MKGRYSNGTGAASLLAALAALAGCSGPERGSLAEMRGRAALISEAEEAAPSPLREAAEPRTRLFPLLFVERQREREVVEALWPLFECGRSSESRFLRFRPFFARERFRDRERLVVFPFFWRVRERRQVGERTIDHLWPFYGVHRREIDLAPAVVHHLVYPLAELRTGPGRFRARLLLAASVSSGYLDRGWWVLPVLKAGTGPGGWEGGNRFLYLLDPLFAYERFSIARPGRPEEPGDTRTEVKLLGGFLGWERSGGRSFLRVFWMRF